ncbi:MAG TPA: VWA containing CoxE family protein, partial [Myxococcota bacterium]
VLRPPKKNRVKLLLLLDVGGSMDPFAALCERLFSAAHQSSHFAAKKTYFFHNCVYDTLYTDISRGIGERTSDVLAQIDQTWTVIFVGDAWMSPHELTFDGNYFSFSQAKTPGIEQLKRIARTARASAWLNPEPQRIWNAPSVREIRRVFPMFELTLDGLDKAVDHLRGAKPVQPL